MKVVVIPQRPIPGILPKNKWIDTKMVLDLNKNEIKHCMQFGNVYDESGKLIDAVNIKNIPDMIKSTGKVVSEPEKKIETPEVTLPEVSEPEIIEEEPVSEEIEVPVEEPVIEEVEPVEDEAPYYIFKIESCVKEDDYINLTLAMDTNSKLEGNLYGLFNITSGPKPLSIEYKSGDNWVKFGSKFANFETISNGDTLSFRFVPKNENEFGIRILIKEANTELLNYECKLNPSTI